MIQTPCQSQFFTDRFRDLEFQDLCVLYIAGFVLLTGLAIEAPHTPVSKKVCDGRAFAVTE